MVHAVRQTREAIDWPAKGAHLAAAAGVLSSLPTFDSSRMARLRRQGWEWVASICGVDHVEVQTPGRNGRAREISCGGGGGVGCG